MRIFVFEYTCAEGTDKQPANFHTEGWAMLSALVEDFSRVDDVNVVTLLHPQCRPQWKHPAARRVEHAEMETSFRALACAADGTLIIAPECDGLLETRSRWVEEAGGRLLGSSPGSIRLTADKLQVSRHWLDRKIPTPETLSFTPDTTMPSTWFPVVCKPRHGAGSQATFRIDKSNRLETCGDQARREGWTGELIVQPFAAGQPASVSFLVGPKQCLPLLPGTQDLSADGRFRYRGGTLPIDPAATDRAVGLAKRAVEATPGLRGFVGVDLVLGKAGDGSQDRVIEINPRPTTSYVGLRALARTNLAEALLLIATGKPAAAPTWRGARIRFRADGTIQELGGI